MSLLKQALALVAAHPAIKKQRWSGLGFDDDVGLQPGA